MKSKLLFLTLALTFSGTAFAESVSSSLTGCCNPAFQNPKAAVNAGKLQVFEMAKTKCEEVNGKLCGVTSITMSPIDSKGICTLTASASPVDATPVEITQHN